MTVDARTTGILKAKTDAAADVTAECAIPAIPKNPKRTTKMSVKKFPKREKTTKNPENYQAKMNLSQNPG